MYQYAIFQALLEVILSNSVVWAGAIFDLVEPY